MFTTKIFIFPSETIEQTQKVMLQKVMFSRPGKRHLIPLTHLIQRHSQLDHEITTERTVAFFKKRDKTIHTTVSESFCMLRKYIHITGLDVCSKIKSQT